MEDLFSEPEEGRGFLDEHGMIEIFLFGGLGLNFPQLHCPQAVVKFRHPRHWISYARNPYVLW